MEEQEFYKVGSLIEGVHTLNLYLVLGKCKELNKLIPGNNYLLFQIHDSSTSFGWSRENFKLVLE